MTFDEQVAMYVYVNGTLADATVAEIATRLNSIILQCGDNCGYDEDVTNAVRKIYCTPYAFMTPETLFEESLCYTARRCSACGKVLICEKRKRSSFERRSLRS